MKDEDPYKGNVIRQATLLIKTWVRFQKKPWAKKKRTDVKKVVN